MYLQMVYPFKTFMFQSLVGNFRFRFKPNLKRFSEAV